MGTTLIYEKLTTIGNNVTALVSDLKTNAEADMKSLQTKATTALTQLQTLANTTQNASFVLVYTDPTPRSNAGANVPSLYSGLLGNPTLQTSFCGTLYRGISGLKKLLDSAVAGLEGFNSSSFLSSLLGVAASVSNLNDGIAGMDKGVQTILRSVESYVSVLDGIIVLFYALVLVSIIMIVAYLVLTKQLGKIFCLRKAKSHSNKQQAKYSMDTEVVLDLKKKQKRYPKKTINNLFKVSFGLIMGTAILGMLLMAVMGVVIPTLHMSCKAVTTGLSSPTAFDELATELRISENVSSIIRECLPGGSSSILTGMGSDGTSLQSNSSKIVNATASISIASIYALAEIVSSSASIDFTTNAAISAALNDVSLDAQSLLWFGRTALRLASSNCFFNPTYNRDSLVPSTDLSSLSSIPCAPGTTIVNCANFSTCGSGCISMYNVMVAAGDLATFQSQIADRYNATPSCASTLSAQFSTNYNNWYLPRVNSGSGIPSVKSRWDGGTKATINSVVTDITALKVKLESILANAGDIVPIIASVTTGLFAGMDCSLFGDDLQLIRNAVCAKTFNHLYTSFVLVSIVSYLLIPILCIFAIARNSDTENAAFLGEEKIIEEIPSKTIQMGPLKLPAGGREVNQKEYDATLEPIGMFEQTGTNSAIQGNAVNTSANHP